MAGAVGYITIIFLLVAAVFLLATKTVGRVFTMIVYGGIGLFIIGIIARYFGYI